MVLVRHTRQVLGLVNKRRIVLEDRVGRLNFPVVDRYLVPKLVKPSAEGGGGLVGGVWTRAETGDGLQDDVQQAHRDAENDQAEAETDAVKLALRMQDFVRALRADVDVVVRRAKSAQAERAPPPVRLTAMVVAVGHRAAAVCLLRADSDRLLLTARVHLAPLLRVEQFLVLLEVADGHAPLVRDIGAPWLGCSVACTEDFAAGQHLRFLSEVGRAILD